MENRRELRIKEGLITNLDMLLNVVGQRADKVYSEDDIIKMLHDCDDVFYATRYGDATNALFAGYKLLRLPIHDNYGNNLFVSLYRTGDEFKGYFVGTYDFLLKKIKDKAAEYYADEDTCKSDSENRFFFVISDLLNRLLSNEYWRDKDGSFDRLVSYLYAVFKRCIKTRSSSLANTLTLLYTIDKKRVCFNTKLIDKYGNFLYLACDDAEDSDNIRMNNIDILVSKSDFIKQGFPTSIFPAAVSFFESLDDVVFKGTLKDFDLNDTNRLDHMVEDSRKTRLPERYRNITNVDFANCVKYSVEMALKLLVTDYRHIVPMYNVRSNNIQFMLPLYLDCKYAETPDIALIVDKDEDSGLYVVKTMIPIEAAYVNSRTLSASTANWLERGMSAKNKEN